MPTYRFKCSYCGYLEDRFSSISELQAMKENSGCCDMLMQTVIQPNRQILIRSMFDQKDVFEHAAETPMQFRDKYHLEDHCEANGIRSRLLEDGDVR